MATIVLDKAIRSLPELITISPQVWVDYDQEADVLYLSFRRPQQATDSELEDNFIYHYDGEELVGVTIIDFKATWSHEEQRINR